MPGDPHSVVLRFLNEDGMDLDEAAQRRIERLYDREESRRVLAAEIGDIGFASRTIEFYTNELANLVDLDAIRAAKFKLVLDYAFGGTSFVMPNVLAKLGADVLAINPNVSTAGRHQLRPGGARSASRRVREVLRRQSRALMIDPDGEQLTLVDDTGHVLDDDEALLALVLLVSHAEPASVIAVPVDASSRVEEICAVAGAEVRRTKLSGTQLIEEAGSPRVSFAGNTSGGFVFPQFLPAFDAVATLVRLLSLLASSGEKMSGIVAGLEKVFIVRREVPTPFEQKGLVMRTLVERADPSELVLLDGLKTIDPDGWTLVLPDPDTPATRIYAEGGSREQAEQRVQKAAEAVEWILKEAVT